MKSVLVLGAGKIGRMVCHFLSQNGDYSVRAGDVSEEALEQVRKECPSVETSRVDFERLSALVSAMEGADAVISCAPFHRNHDIAKAALETKTHYLDLTEDVEVTEQVAKLAEGAPVAFIPQCGLAPGFITIVGKHLMSSLDETYDLRLRVGALPRYPSNRMKYNLTWSTEGLINEYCNPCEVILNGEMRNVQPLQNLEQLTIDGVEYEAFNTSGGLGTFAQSLQGVVRNLNYKSIRYPGHHGLLKLLLDDLGMEHDQKLLGDIFERSLPLTLQDQIVIFVSAKGKNEGRLVDNTYARTIYHQMIDGIDRTGIQITTAAGVCAVLDLLREGKLPQKGFVRQEEVAYDAFIENRFGRYYA